MIDRLGCLAEAGCVNVPADTANLAFPDLRSLGRRSGPIVQERCVHETNLLLDLLIYEDQPGADRFICIG